MNKYYVIISMFFLLSIPFFANAQTTGSESKVTVEHAEKTTSIKNSDTGTTIISLSGNVIVSVLKGTEKTTIRAQRIHFNRKHNMLYATGEVNLTRETSGKETENILAHSVLFNTTTQEGAFYDGHISQTQQGAINIEGSSSLFVSSPLFGRGKQGSVTFDKATLTLCDEENPHWKIKASRIWLLPGDEFSFANALLYIGEIPILYFPFFYYPKDEMIFNPVFGYKEREGYFFQTTTYIIGRKALEKIDKDKDKGFNFMKQTKLKEQQREGLFLHNLSGEAKMPQNYFKIMADYYSNLGAMVGFEGKRVPEKTFSTTSFNTRLGFTNTLFTGPIEGAYIRSSPSAKTYYDKPWLFGMQFPFRFTAELKTGLHYTGGSVNLSLPIYSDPFFNSDFNDRSEHMDWIRFFMDQTSSGADSETTGSPTSEISGFTWSLTGNYSPSFEILKPWLNQFSVSSFSSSMSFSSKISEHFSAGEILDGVAANSPERKFYYLSSFNPLNMRLSFAGTAFTYPYTKPSVAHSRLSAEEQKKKAERNLLLASMISSEDKTNKSETKTEQGEGESKTESENEPDKKEIILSQITLPHVSITAPKAQTEPQSNFNVTWSMRPAFDSNVFYSSSTVNHTSSLFKDPKYSYITVKCPVTLNSTANIKGKWLGLTQSIHCNPQYQRHPYLSDENTEEQKNKIIINDYAMQKITATNNNRIVFAPFVFTNVLKKTSLTWSNTNKIVESTFTGSIDKPQWEYDFIEWDKNYITAHNLKTTLGISLWYITQTFALTADLPPRTERYLGVYTFSIPDGSIKLSSGYRKKSDESSDWVFDPFVQSFSYTICKKVRLSQSYQYDIEEKHNTSLSCQMSWNNLSAAYNMKYEYPKKLDINTGWVSEPEKKFLPYSGSLSYTPSFKERTNNSKTVSITPKISSSLTWDMIRPTNSCFTFRPSLTFKIKDFISISFASQSTNKVLLRYVQDVVKDFEGYNLPEIPGEKNILKDLFNSFAFWDQNKREQSGFKLNNLSLSVEHDLHDWTMKSEYKLSPRIITDSQPYYYDFSPYFTISVVWKPMTGMKTVIEDKYGEFVLNP